MVKLISIDMLFIYIFYGLFQEEGSPSEAKQNLQDLDTEDLYTKYKKLQQMLEFLEVQEEYIKDEQRNLKKEYLHAQEEVKRIQSVPLVIGQFLEAVDQNTGIVGSTTGRCISSFVKILVFLIEFLYFYVYVCEK